MDPATTKAEQLACAESPLYFIGQHTRIYDPSGSWIPFTLWPEQVRALDVMTNNRLAVVLKARQLGLSWLCLGYALWTMLFRPAATVLMFSRREEEALYLLGEERLRGMYRRLPEWLKVPTAEPDQARTWTLANGSVARAFPSNCGDSYTASLVVIDECDLVDDLARLMRSVKPTIDGGGRMILVSRADKSKPESEFKRLYRQAKAGAISWAPVFLPWNARPDRGQDWYDEQKRDTLNRTGALDDLHEQYPATDTEALAPRSLDKRIPSEWLQQCFMEHQPLVDLEGGPAIPGLVVYALPKPGRQYVIGGDPAEGNPTSDESAAAVLDRRTGEQVAMLAGRFEPATFAAHMDNIGRWFNHARLMIERNNHGHAVQLWFRDHSRLQLLTGHDGQVGWLSNTKGKALLWDGAAESFRDKETILRDFTTFCQLSSIDGSTLRAPEGEHDDRAVSYALALSAIVRGGRTTPPMMLSGCPDPYAYGPSYGVPQGPSLAPIQRREQRGWQGWTVTKRE